MIASILFLAAAVFYLIAGLGLLRLPDPLARLHAGTKASSLATALALGAAVAHHATWWSALVCAACLLFVFLTAPLASHAIGRCVLASRLPGPDQHNGRHASRSSNRPSVPDDLPDPLPPGSQPE